MDSNEKRDIRAALYSQNSVHDMLQLLCKKYDLSDPVNPLTQGLIAEQLLKGLAIINPKKHDE
jgi:hypothetical protein